MNNMPILSDLRVFVLVARRAGFTAAAEELGVSPAFISKRIALLEKALDVSLLHRTTRRVAITGTANASTNGRSAFSTTSIR